MKVRELVAELQKLDQEAEVHVPHQCCPNTELGSLRDVTFFQSEDRPSWWPCDHDRCVVIE